MAIAIALLAGLGGEDESDNVQTPALPALDVNEREAADGIVISAPASWERVENDEGVIRLRSPDGEAQVLVSAPVDTGQADAALRAELEAVAGEYEVIEVGRPTRQTVGGLNGRQVVLTVADENGRKLRLLMITADGEEHTYVVEVVTAANVEEKRLVEGQAIVNELELNE